MPAVNLFKRPLVRRARRSHALRIPVVGALVCLQALLVLGEAKATHETVMGVTHYPGGGNAGPNVTVAFANDTVTVNATGVATDVPGATYNLVAGNHFWDPVLGKDIPCYLNRRTVRIGIVADASGNLPNTSFNASVLPVGNYELCFFEQPFRTVTAPVYLARR